MHEWKTEILGELFLVKNDKTKQLNSDAYQAVGKYPIVDQSISPICGYSDDTSKVYNTNIPVTIFGDHTRHVKYVDYPFIAGADGTQILKPIFLEDKYFYYTVLYASERIGNYGYDRHLKHLKEYETVYPVKESAQRRIAHILTTCDAVIEKTQAAIAKHKAIKQGMLHDLFTRGIDITTGKLRPKYEEAPALYKESKLGMVPIDWEVDELMKYLSFISYGFTNPMPETNNGPFLVTAANVNRGKILYDTCRKTSRAAFDNLLTDKSRPKRNDILLTKDGTLGRVALVEQENLCINQSVAVLRPNSLIQPLFLKILLESPSYQKTMLDEAGGSTIKHIYITIVDKMLVAVPENIDEQKEIASRLNTIESEIQNEQNYLHKLQSIKQGLMADLLSGKKRVKLPKEELKVLK